MGVISMDEAEEMPPMSMILVQAQSNKLFCELDGVMALVEQCIADEADLEDFKEFMKLHTTNAEAYLMTM